MVAQTIKLPNIRRLFIPDPGYVLIDADLVGADAQVVAWEAEDEDLKAAFRAGVNIHIKNARDIFPEKTANMTDEEIALTDVPGGLYHDNKRAIHLTNYAGKYRTMARVLGWSEDESLKFSTRWFALHPSLSAWHERVGEQLVANRTIYNKFGYRIVYFDRMKSLLPDALAWIAQSTVALCCSKGALRLVDAFPWVELLLQVHDELVFQVPTRHSDKLDQFRTTLEVPVPYDDQLIIPWKLKTSTNSWGEVW